MHQYTTTLSDKSLTDLTADTNEMLKLIPDSTLHSITYAQDTYFAVIVCPYDSVQKLSELEDMIIEIKEQLGMKGIKWREVNETI